MKKLLTSVSLLLSIHIALFAQATTQVSGIVTDPTGAVIPNAAIELLNADTGLKRTATSDASGAYSFVQVIPGPYRLSATATGFRTTTITDVRLLVANPATVNIKLEVGQVSESVSVTAEAVQINTTDASIGNAIGTKPIMQMPLNARNIVGLLALQPGVVFTKEDDTDDRNGAVNGGKSDQANVMLDGVDVNDQMDRQAFTSVLRMTPDAVQEFRVTTGNSNADSGRSSGAQVQLVTKSGTNDFHGALYEYHRNTLTSANSFFRNSSDVERLKLIRNIFGTAVGGPIKKDRLFFFANYEGRRDAKDSDVLRDVPSMNMRQGILQYQRNDGTIATVTPEDIASNLDPRGVNAAALKLMQGYPVPNDDGEFDKLNIVGYRFKAPTPLRWNTYITRLDYSVDPNGKNTVFFRGNLQNDREAALPQFPGQAPNTVTLRNNKGFATGLTSLLRPNLISNFRYGFTRVGWESTGAADPAIASMSPVRLRGLSDSVGFTRHFAAIIPVHTFSEDLTWTKGSHNVQFGGVIRITRNKRNSLQNSFSTATANASWLVSSGSPLNRPWRGDMSSDGILPFRYAMADVMGLVTQATARYNYRVDGSIIGEGNPVLRDFASEEYEMYLQDTWKVSRGLTITAGLRYSLMPPFYEANGQQVSPNVRIGDWFDLRGGLAEQGKSQMEAGRISFIPSGGPGGRPLYDFHKKNFAPRLALAYSPQGTGGLSKFLFGGPGQTSIRTGFGMYYDLFGSGLMRSYDASAFGLTNELVNPSAELTVATAPRFTGIGQIPQSILTQAPPAKFPAVYPDNFAITNGLDDTLRPPYSMTANFSIGREFRGGWFAQGSYVGRFSRRSLIRRDAAMPTNLKDPKSGMDYYTAATILAKQVVKEVPTSQVQKVPYWENLYSNIAYGGMTATQVAYETFASSPYDWTYGLYQLDTDRGGCVEYASCSDLGPYASFNPQFSSLSVFSSVGGGNYHAAQFTVRKRFSSGDNVDINYTFSKSTDLRSFTERADWADGVLWNPWKPGLQKGVSDYDNTHLLNMLGVYSLPFGKGKRFGSDMSRVLNAFVGGWQISGMWRWSSGFPISVFETGVWPTNWNNNNWAQWNLKPVSTKTTKNAPGVGGPNMFSDPQSASGAFDYVMPGEIGMRNGLRGDGIFNIDTNVSKRFVMPYLDGKHSIQFRWETFNLTNTAKFDVSTASLDISSAGTFGKYIDQLTQPRVMQFGLRYEF